MIMRRIRRMNPNRPTACSRNKRKMERAKKTRTEPERLSPKRKKAPIKETQPAQDEDPGEDLHSSRPELALTTLLPISRAGKNKGRAYLESTPLRVKVKI